MRACIALTAPYCISVLLQSSIDARSTTSVRKPDERGEKHKKIFEEKYGKDRVSAWLPGHFLLSCLLVYRLYSPTAENGLLFPRHGIATAENAVPTSQLLDFPCAHVFMHYCEKRRKRKFINIQRV